jgi:hypothetical protein
MQIVITHVQLKIEELPAHQMEEYQSQSSHPPAETATAIRCDFIDGLSQSREYRPLLSCCI